MLRGVAKYPVHIYVYVYVFVYVYVYVCVCVFVQEAVGPHVIAAAEHAFAQRALAIFQTMPNLILMGNTKVA